MSKKPNGSRRKSIDSKLLLKQVRKAIASLEGRKKTLESVEQMEALAPLWPFYRRIQLTGFRERRQHSSAACIVHSAPSSLSEESLGEV